MASDEELTRRVIEIAAQLGEWYPPEVVPNWFFATQPYLDGKRPIDMIGNDQDWETLKGRVHSLMSGAFS